MDNFSCADLTDMKLISKYNFKKIDFGYVLIIVLLNMHGLSL